MLSRLPSSRQWSMSASHTAPMSRRRGGGVFVLRRRHRRPAVLEQVGHLANYLLRRHHVPNAVARQDDELVGGVSLEGPDLGEGRHGLPLRRLRLAPFVHKISDGARYREVAVYPAELDLAAGGEDALLLLGVVRLVVVGQRHCLAAPAEDGARVAGVGADDVRG